MIKNLINVRSSCRSKPILAALRIESLTSRLTKMKLSLLNRLKENEYTNAVINECTKQNVPLILASEAENETKELSNALSIENKCVMKIEIISHASKEDWKLNKKAQELIKIFDSIDKTKISSLITFATSNYVPKFMIN